VCHNFYSNFIVNHTSIVDNLCIIPSVTKKKTVFCFLHWNVCTSMLYCTLHIAIWEFLFLKQNHTSGYPKQKHICSHMPFFNHYHILKRIMWPIDILSIYRCPRFCQTYPEYWVKSPSVMIGAVCTSRSELTTLQRNRQISKIWLS